MLLNPASAQAADVNETRVGTERAGIAARQAAPPASPVGRPGLGVITYAPQGGGVAYVARLLRLALGTGGAADPLSIALDAASASRVSAYEAARFAGRLFVANAARRADWFLFSHPGIARAQYRIPAALRRPYAVQMHGTEVWGEHVPEALFHAALCIAPSRYTAQRATAAHPRLRNVVVVPHGLLPDDEPSDGVADDAMLARVGPNAAVIVGRLWSVERQKGHDQLLDCWPAVLARVPDAQLVIVGTGDDEPRYRRRAEELGIGGNVLFTGYASSATLRALLRRVAVFAMPSRQEGFGIAYLEAMREGLPCIASTDDGATEPVVDGETGFLVEQSDRRALADALVAVFIDRDLRGRLGAAGRRRYESMFTFERYRERLLAAIAERFGRA